jgi:hypothetical protein
MSFEALEAQRRDAVDAILGKVGEAIEQAEQTASGKTSDPKLKKLMAARIALEYAVLATARERKMATEVVATALTNAAIDQQAAMMKSGAEALARAYRVEPHMLVNVFAGRLTDMAMPEGLGSTPELDKMVDTCRTLVTDIVKTQYSQRGRLQAADGARHASDPFKSDGVQSPAKNELAARLAFLNSSVDAAVAKGAVSEGGGGALKDRIEAQIFQPRPPQSVQFSKPLAAFLAQHGTALRIELMTEVRGVTQSRTVQEIAAKLKAMMVVSGTGTQERQSDHRAHKPLER